MFEARLQTMCNVLEYCKLFKNDSVRLRFGCVYFFNVLKFSTVLVLDLRFNQYHVAQLYL